MQDPPSSSSPWFDLESLADAPGDSGTSFTIDKTPMLELRSAVDKRSLAHHTTTTDDELSGGARSPSARFVAGPQFFRHDLHGCLRDPRGVPTTLFCGAHVPMVLCALANGFLYWSFRYLVADFVSHSWYAAAAARAGGDDQKTLAVKQDYLPGSMYYLMDLPSSLALVAGLLCDYRPLFGSRRRAQVDRNKAHLEVCYALSLSRAPNQSSSKHLAATTANQPSKQIDWLTRLRGRYGPGTSAEG